MDKVGLLLLGASLAAALPFTPARRWLFTRWPWIGGAIAAVIVAPHGAQHYSDRFGWEELAAAASKAYLALPAGDRASCVIITANYGQAAALEYWARRYTLPPVVSGHNNYFLWGPGTRSWDPALVVGYDREDLHEVYAAVEEVARVSAPWALERNTVLVARGLTRPRDSVWPLLRQFI
jgi:hypothetical protein